MQLRHSIQIQIEGRRTSTGWQAFTFSRRSRIILNAEANGEPIQILLDSGAEQTVVDSRLAARLDLSKIGSTTFSDRQSIIAGAIVDGLHLKVGALRIDGLTATVADLSPVRSMTGVEVGILLGREIFEETVVDIDFPHERIAFSLADGPSLPEGAVATALRRVPGGERRAINVLLEDKLPVWLELDLGSANTIILQHQFWSSRDLTSNRRLSNSLVGGVGGIREVGLVSLRSVKLAGFSLRNVDAVLEPPRGNLEGQLGSGTIGMPILSKFRIVTDFRRDRLYLVQESGSDLGDLPRNRSGLRVIQEGEALKVILVARESPAERAGWALGERIVAVEGHPIDERYWSGAGSRWAEAPAGTKVSLTLADGSTRVLELADYY